VIDAGNPQHVLTPGIARYTCPREENMADTQLQVLTPTFNRQGIFDGFDINGSQYENANGELGWHITAWPGHDPVNVYWVSGQKFYSAKIHLLPAPVCEVRLETFDEISFVEAAEKTAILKAIAVWEKQNLQ
jgi:hypothetical protein